MKRREDSENRFGAVSQGPAGPRRRGLLAKTHIAAKELALSESDYRGLLARAFGVRSAGELSTEALERLLDHLVAIGWRPRRRRSGKAAGTARQRRKQVSALQRRARKVFSGFADRDERRLRGLCQKICQANDLASCRDAEKLKRLLAVLESIRKSETRQLRILGGDPPPFRGPGASGFDFHHQEDPKPSAHPSDS
jgi:phage gp16-like protein